MIEFKHNKIYKIIHKDISPCWECRRNYIICSPIYDQTYPSSEGSYTKMPSFFIICFDGEIKAYEPSLGYAATCFYDNCELAELDSKDWEEVKRACIKFGYKYNRKLGELIVKKD